MIIDKVIDMQLSMLLQDMDICARKYEVEEYEKLALMRHVILREMQYGEEMFTWIFALENGLLSKKIQEDWADSIEAELDKHGLTAVYHDWDEEKDSKAVDRINELLKEGWSIKSHRYWTTLLTKKPVSIKNIETSVQ